MVLRVTPSLPRLIFAEAKRASLSLWSLLLYLRRQAASRKSRCCRPSRGDGSRPRQRRLRLLRDDAGSRRACCSAGGRHEGGNSGDTDNGGAVATCMLTVARDPHRQVRIRCNSCRTAPRQCGRRCNQVAPTGSAQSGGNATSAAATVGSDPTPPRAGSSADLVYSLEARH